MLVEILILVGLVLLSAFFSGSETAYTSISILQVQRLQSERGVRGKMIAKFVSRSDILLGTVLIGNNLANIAASALATEVTIKLVGNSAVGVVTGILTIFILVFGEITPKRFSILFNETVCLHTIRLITVLSILFRPLIWVLSGVSTILTRLSGSQRNASMTMEGLLHMVNLAESLGIVANQETRMVKSIFRFNEVTVQAIITHRTEVFSLEMNSRISEVIKEISAEGYSRIPVYDGHPEKIEGIVHLKDIISELAEGRTSTKLKEIMIRPLFLSTNRKINEVFRHFKREKLNMAVVMDEYGGLAGIVTLEDIIEEILGELHDENEEMEWEKITALSDGSFRIMGDAPLHQVNDYLGIRLVQGRYAQTLGGYLSEILDRFPTEREEIPVDRAVFTIERVSKNRIISVRCVLRADEVDHEAVAE
ncbi:MAG TPA: hemolysin family protein [Spirochaetia bacterium]|nr:hemolysin family protein [Spirochaetia bacterium]